MNVLHKGLLLQDWVFRLGAKLGFKAKKQCCLILKEFCIILLFFGNAFLVVKKMCSFINVGGFKLNDTVSKCINLTPIISGTTYS